MAPTQAQFDRSTPEQLEFYVNFCRAHPNFQCGKNNPKEPKMIVDLWQELSNVLNAQRGPSRTSAKWKETLTNWRNQLRSRARKLNMEQRLTGGGQSNARKLTKFEELALCTFGAAAVDGLQGVTALGIAASTCNDEATSSAIGSIEMSPLIDAETLTYDSIPTPENNVTITEQTSLTPNVHTLPASSISVTSSPFAASLASVSPSHIAHSTPPPSAPKKRPSSDEMYRTFLEKIERREQREKEATERDNQLVQAMKGIHNCLEELVKKYNNS